MIKDREKVQAALEEKFCKGCEHFVSEANVSGCDGDLDEETDCVVYNIIDNMWDWDWEDAESDEDEEDEGEGEEDRG